MDAIEVSTPVALIAPQKRTLDDAEHEPSVSTPNRNISSTASTPLSAAASVATPSPLKNTASAVPPSSNISVAGDPLTPTPGATSAATSTQPAKRRKLTDQEKKDREAEKEAKAKAAAEKKAQKEIEDKAKAEQKAQKDEEKRKKNEEKEEKRRVKEQKQQQEEEDKRKKERSQMKLNAFFTKPKPTEETSEKSMVDTVQNPATANILLPPETALTSTDSAPPSPQKAILKNAKTDYEKFFLPYSLPPRAILAPVNPFLVDSETLAAAQNQMDRLTAREDVEMEPITLETVRSLFPKRRRGMQTATIAEIVDLVNGSADRPIDLTGDSSKPIRPLELLKQVPMKYLHFPEDVRPPYHGTYTKPHTRLEEGKVARNPIWRGLSDLNYDYDSEAEWEEPEEGEDLGSDGDEDLDEDGDEEMDDFLDDDEDPQLKRRLLNGDQEPVSTGLCWEDSRGVSRLNDGSGAISTEFRDFRMGFLLEPQPQSIDPFSTSYWAPEPAPAFTNQQPTIKDMTSGSMNPPRLPLTARPINGLLNTMNPTQKSSTGSTAKAVKPMRMIAPDQLQAFKSEVEGQDLTKIGMIEALKKKFPKVPKDAIVNTLTAVAQRVGPSAKEKRWVLLD